VPNSEVELRAIEADQRIRDATLVVRAMRPEQRDLTPLLELLGTEALRGGAIEFYTVDWANSYEVDGRIDVSGDEMVVATCERDWINMINVNGERSVFRGGRASARAVARTFRRSEDGTWVNVAKRQGFEICKGVESPVTR
jgi:hypothetical protein